MISNASNMWPFEALKAVEAAQIAGVTRILEAVAVVEGAVTVPDAVEATMLLGDIDVCRAQISCGQADDHLSLVSACPSCLRHCEPGQNRH